MGTMYRTKSANVLNEADRYERILNHQLFTMEQENMLWGYREDVSWIPGDPLWPRPGLQHHALEDFEGDASLQEDLRALGVRSRDNMIDSETYEGNCTRRMIDLFDDDIDAPTIRCKECETWWRGPEPCFSCWKFDRPIGPQPELPMGRRYSSEEFAQHHGVRGMRWGQVGERTYEAGVDRGILYIPGANPAAPLEGVPWDGLTTVTEGPSGLEDFDFGFRHYTYLLEADISNFVTGMNRASETLRVVAERMQAQMYSALFSPNEMRRLLGFDRVDEDAWRRANPAWNGPRLQYSIVDEGLSWERNVVPYDGPPPNPFERDVPERIVTASISESAAEPIVEDTVAFYRNFSTVASRSSRSRIRLPPMTPEQLGPQRRAIPELVMEPLPPLVQSEEILYPTSRRRLDRR